MEREGLEKGKWMGRRWRGVNGWEWAKGKWKGRGWRRVNRRGGARKDNGEEELKRGNWKGSGWRRIIERKELENDNGEEGAGEVWRGRS